MKVLAYQIGLTVLATLVAGLCCSMAAALFAGPSDMIAALGATLASLPCGIAVVLYIHRSGATVPAVLIGTFLRLIITALIGGISALVFPSLRTSTYCLTLGVVYLANLAVETWILLEKNRQSARLSPSKSGRDANPLHCT